MKQPIAAVALVTVFLAAAPLFAMADLGSEAAADALRRGSVTDALRIADSLGRAQNANARVRAKSLRYLGDHQFVKGDHKKAADFYLRASKLDNASIYRYLYALALAADGQSAQAAEILRAIAVVSSDPMGGEAALILEQLKAEGAAPAAKPAATDPQAGQSAQNIVFTIQVGAFGSKENADNLVKRLTGTYEDITISPTTGGDQTLYRVRIGTFQNRDEASAFAERLISDAGMSARVVEK